MPAEAQPGRGQSGARGAANVAAGFKVDNSSIRQLVSLWRDLNREVKKFNTELGKISSTKLDALAKAHGGSGSGGSRTTTESPMSTPLGDGTGGGGRGQAAEEGTGGGFKLSRGAKVGLAVVGGAAAAYGASKMENWVNADRLSQYTAWGTPYGQGSAGDQMGAARHFWFGGQGQKGLTGFTSTSDALQGLQMVGASAGSLSMSSRSQGAQLAAGRAGNVMGDMTTGAAASLGMRTPQMYYNMMALGVQTSRAGQRAAPESVAQQFLTSQFGGRMPTASEIAAGMETGAPLRRNMEMAGLGQEAQDYISRYGMMASRLSAQQGGKPVTTRQMIGELSKTGGRSEKAQDAWGSTVFDTQKRRSQTRSQTEQELADGALPTLRRSIETTTKGFDALNKALGFGGLGNIAGGGFSLAAGPGAAAQNFMGSAMGGMASMYMMTHYGPGAVRGRPGVPGIGGIPGVGKVLGGAGKLLGGGGALRSAARFGGVAALTVGGIEGGRAIANSSDNPWAKVGGRATQGAGIGAAVGMLGGPFAELTVPGGAAIGGLAGGVMGAFEGFGGADEYVGVSKEEDSLVSSAWNSAIGGSDVSTLGRGQDSTVSGAAGSTDGTGTDVDATGAAAGATDRGRRALAWMQAQHNKPSQSWARKCLSAVRQSLGVPGGVYDALTSWAGTKKRRGLGTPPPGVPVWWGGGPNGHIALSAGGGMVWSNDIRRKGKIDMVPINEITKKWGKPYYGWSEDVNGVDVYNPKANVSTQGAQAAASGTRMDVQSVFKLARDVGFDRAASVLMTAIAGAESGYYPGNHNLNAGTGDDSYGLWQINMLGGLGPPRRKQFGLRHDSDLFDPRTNARAAWGISGNGRNFTPWSAYKNGSYKQYMKRAQDAATALPHYSIGAYNVGSDQVAVIHEGEMILPRKQAQRIRDYVRRQQVANTTAGATVAGGSGGGRGAVHVTLNMPIQTVTGITTADAKRLVSMVARELEADDRIAAVAGGD